MQSRLKVVNWGILNKQFRTLVQLGQIQKATFKWTVALQYFSEIENIYEKRCYLSKLSQTLKKMKHNSFKAKFANYLKYQDKKADIFCALLVLLIPWDIFSISGGRNEWIFPFVVCQHKDQLEEKSVGARHIFCSTLSLKWMTQGHLADRFQLACS